VRIYFQRITGGGNLFSKRRASSEYPKINCTTHKQAYSSHYTAIAGLITSWGRANNQQEGCPGLADRNCRTKVPQRSHTAKPDKDSWAFASPVYTGYPLMSQLGGLLPQLTPGHQVPILD